MTTRELAAKIYNDLYSAALIDVTDEENVDYVENLIIEDQKECGDAALAEAARLLKHTGSLNAAKLIEEWLEDRRRLRDGKATAMPALRAAVLLPE